MGLERVGVLLFGVGLCLSLLYAVAFGYVGGVSEVGCGDHEPTYSIEHVRPAALDIAYDNGCNEIWISSAVTVGALVSLSGLLVAGAGVLREWSAAD